MNLKKIMLDPKTVLAAVFGGFLIGLFARPLGTVLFPIGSLYIAFLSMCLLPILITAIIHGIAGLLRDASTRPLFKGMATLYAVGLLIPCAVGIGIAVLLGPGTDLGAEAQESIGALIIASPPEDKTDGGVLGFLVQIVPHNLFEALSTNDVMGIVFLSICLGLAMGMLRTGPVDRALDFVQAVYDVFMQLFRWAIVLLAPGLLLFIAGVVADIDASTLLAMTKFVVIFYIGGLILMIVYLALFWFANQHGAVFLLSFLTIYLAQIYVIDLAAQDYLVIAVGSIIAGATAVGGGPVLIPTVAPILGAVGIPTSMALVVLSTTDSLIGPVRTVTTLQANITLTAMTARRGKEILASRVDAKGGAEEGA